MCYSPYPVCVGRKFRFPRTLFKPLSIIFETTLCNNIFINKEKHKIRLLQHVIRLFYKDSLGFKVTAVFKNGSKCNIQNNDVIHLVCTGNKSAVKKMLSKIGYEWNDYKILKRRGYTLVFIYFFCECDKPPNKEVSLDISSNEYDTFTFIFTLNLYYLKDMMQLLFFYYLEEKNEKPILVPNINEVPPPKVIDPKSYNLRTSSFLQKVFKYEKWELEEMTDEAISRIF